MKILNYYGLSYLIEELKDKFVQQQAGSGLSSNDFTNILKEKLESVESGAEKNKVLSVNNKEGNVIVTSDDIEFLSAISGATPTTVKAIIDDIINKDKAQDIELSKKANKSNTYTKDEVDGQINNIDSGVISVNEKSGTVVIDADDISDTTTTKKFVTDSQKTEWDNKVEVSYVDTMANKKVDKITGKKLSANDFTNILKSKLDAIEAGANKNLIELVQKNGVNLPLNGKTVNIEVPTKIGELTNDKNYQTKAEIQALIADQGKLKKEIVSVLPIPTSADDNTLYLVRNQNNDGYEEWMVINGEWEILGDTAAVDFTGYVHEDDIKTISNAEIDALLNA